MDKLRALLADASEYLAAATEREKRLLLLAAAGVIAFAVMLTSAAFSRAIGSAQATLEEKQQDFEKVQKLSVTYAAQEQERQMLEARLRQSPPALTSFIEGLTRNEGLEIGSVSDRGLVGGGQNGRARENSIEVNLNRVPLDKLVRILQAIDRSPGLVRVRGLRMHRADNKESLDVRLTVSAWLAS